MSPNKSKAPKSNDKAIYIYVIKLAHAVTVWNGIKLTVTSKQGPPM